MQRVMYEQHVADCLRSDTAPDGEPFSKILDGTTTNDELVITVGAKNLDDGTTATKLLVADTDEASPTFLYATANVGTGSSDLRPYLASPLTLDPSAPTPKTSWGGDNTLIETAQDASTRLPTELAIPFSNSKLARLRAPESLHTFGVLALAALSPNTLERSRALVARLAGDLLSFESALDTTFTPTARLLGSVERVNGGTEARLLAAMDDPSKALGRNGLLHNDKSGELLEISNLPDEAKIREELQELEAEYWSIGARYGFKQGESVEGDRLRNDLQRRKEMASATLAYLSLWRREALQEHWRYGVSVKLGKVATIGGIGIIPR